MREEKEPTATVSGLNETTYQHDAYGTITLTTVTGGAATLFGSDLGHHQRVRLTVNRATLDRHLSQDWIHGRGKLLELEMSHAQFAQFITSNGNGSGTPVTLKYAPAPDAQIAEMPDIKKLETKHETFRREIQESSKQKIAAMREQIDKLGGMIESGKAGKKELRELQHTLKCLAENLPGSMAFVVESAETALEKATQDAKIEVEAYVDATARRLGLESISQLGQLGNTGHTMKAIITSADEGETT